MPTKTRRLFLLGLEDLGLDGHDLSKHDNTVAVHERDAGQTLAVLEGVRDERLLRLEGDLGHLVGLEGVRLLHLLATGLLTHLPLEGGDTARGAAAAHETDRGVADLDLVRDVQDLDLGIKGLDSGQGGVLLVDHDVTGARHVLLVQVLHVHTDVVTRLGLRHSLVVHLDLEHLTGARVGGGVGRQEDDLLVRLDDTLLDAAGQDITDTLDLVDTRDRQTHRGVDRALRDAAHVVQAVEEGVTVDGLGADLDVSALPPGHVGGLLDQVVTAPTGDRHVGDAGLNEVLLPADLRQHGAHLVGDLVVAGLLVASHVAVHLVDTDDDLLDTEQVDQTGVLTGLALDLTGLVVTTLDGDGEVTISRDHDHGNIGLGGTGNHVLDEITVTRGIDDGVVPLRGEELLGGHGDGHTTLTLLLLTVHVEREGKGRLAQAVGLGLQLLELTLLDTAQLEEKVSGGGGLTRVDVTADHDRQMLLALSGHFGGFACSFGSE